MCGLSYITGYFGTYNGNAAVIIRPGSGWGAGHATSAETVASFTFEYPVTDGFGHQAEDWKQVATFLGWERLMTLA